MDDITKVRQGAIPFWGGPAHGEQRMVNNRVVYIPVFNSLNYMNIQDLDVTVSVDYITVTYCIFEFMWFWNEKWYSGEVMMSDDSNFKEVEALMNFISGLFGGDNDQRRSLRAYRTNR